MKGGVAFAPEPQDFEDVFDCEFRDPSGTRQIGSARLRVALEGIALENQNGPLGKFSFTRILSWSVTDDVCFTFTVKTEQKDRQDISLWGSHQLIAAISKSVDVKVARLMALKKQGVDINKIRSPQGMAPPGMGAMMTPQQSQPQKSKPFSKLSKLFTPRSARNNASSSQAPPPGSFFPPMGTPTPQNGYVPMQPQGMPPMMDGHGYAQQQQQQMMMSGMQQPQMGMGPNAYHPHQQQQHPQHQPMQPFPPGPSAMQMPQAATPQAATPSGAAMAATPGPPPSAAKPSSLEPFFRTDATPGPATASKGAMPTPAGANPYASLSPPPSTDPAASSAAAAAPTPPPPVASAPAAALPPEPSASGGGGGADRASLESALSHTREYALRMKDALLQRDEKVIASEKRVKEVEAREEETKTKLRTLEDQVQKLLREQKEEYSQLRQDVDLMKGAHGINGTAGVNGAAGPGLLPALPPAPSDRQLAYFGTAGAGADADAASTAERESLQSYKDEAEALRRANSKLREQNNALLGAGAGAGGVTNGTGPSGGATHPSSSSSGEVYALRGMVAKLERDKAELVSKVERQEMQLEDYEAAVAQSLTGELGLTSGGGGYGGGGGGYGGGGGFGADLYSRPSDPMQQLKALMGEAYIVKMALKKQSNPDKAYVIDALDNWIMASHTLKKVCTF